MNQLSTPAHATTRAPPRLQVEPSQDRPVVGGRHVAPPARVLGDARRLRPAGLEHHAHILRRLEKDLAYRDVIDDLVATPEPPRGPLAFGQPPGKVPQAHRIASVSDVEGAGVELGPWRPVQDLGGGGFWLVIEVAKH